MILFGEKSLISVQVLDKQIHGLAVTQGMGKVFRNNYRILFSEFFQSCYNILYELFVLWTFLYHLKKRLILRKYLSLIVGDM